MRGIKITEIEPSSIGYRRFRYKSKKGEISLITPSSISMGMWEIFCVKGELFDGIERFDQKEDAEQRIKELLK